jgi:hypothetical protein
MDDTWQVLVAHLTSQPEGIGDRAFLWAVREAVLGLLDALERKLAIEPRTAEIRHEWRRLRHQAAEDY